MYDTAKTMNPPRTVEEVVKDFKDRRAGIIKALTKDVEEFYQLCDPKSPNLCLYGFPNQHWEVNLPPPSDLPEPRLGINFVRDTMTKHEWLSMVALHSDTWLYSIASYFATKFGFDKADKKRLFNKITDVPSISDVMEGRKANKRTKIEYRGLPQHILHQEILSRLPVKDLLKYRSVCNTWRSLIDDSSLVSQHLKNYRNNSEASHLLVFCRAYRVGDEQALVRRSDTFRKVQELKNVYAFYNFVSYVNGVILVRTGSYNLFSEIILWNPSINRVLNVPNSMFEAMRGATFVELGLGYDASCNDYKVVAIVYPKAESMYNFGWVRYRATAPELVHVYTLDSDTWTAKHGVSAPPYWSVGKQVYVNGAIHWINFGPNVADDLWYKTKDSYVVLFDVEFEVFKYFELPSGMKSDDDEKKEKLPTVLSGLFAIFCAQETQHDVWVMTEYGVSDSWSKMYTFTLQIDKLLHFNSDGELLFAVNGKGIKSYNVIRKRVKDLAKTYSKSSNYTIYPYVESLVLLKEGTVKTIQVNDIVLHTI